MDSKIIPLAKVDFPIWRPVEQLMGIIYTNQGNYNLAAQLLHSWPICIWEFQRKNYKDYCNEDVAVPIYDSILTYLFRGRVL